MKNKNHSNGANPHMSKYQQRLARRQEPEGEQPENQGDGTVQSLSVSDEPQREPRHRGHHHKGYRHQKPERISLVGPYAVRLSESDNREGELVGFIQSEEEEIDGKIVFFEQQPRMATAGQVGFVEFASKFWTRNYVFGHLIGGKSYPGKLDDAHATFTREREEIWKAEEDRRQQLRDERQERFERWSQYLEVVRNGKTTGGCNLMMEAMGIPMDITPAEDPEEGGNLVTVRPAKSTTDEFRFIIGLRETALVVLRDLIYSNLDGREFTEEEFVTGWRVMGFQEGLNPTEDPEHPEPTLAIAVMKPGVPAAPVEARPAEVKASVQPRQQNKPAEVKPAARPVAPARSFADQLDQAVNAQKPAAQKPAAQKPVEEKERPLDGVVGDHGGFGVSSLPPVVERPVQMAPQTISTAAFSIGSFGAVNADLVTGFKTFSTLPVGTLTFGEVK